MDKSKKKGITWGEAAKMVLEHSLKPLNHKEILQAILDRNLKEVNLKFSQALACLNAMLHANSRTPSSLFIKIGGRSCCYRLNENRTDLLDSSDSDSDSPGSSSNDAETKEAGQDNMENHPGISSSDMSVPLGSLPPISSILGSYPNHATSSSVSSTIACAIADSRLSSLIAPTPDTAPVRSSLAKKRSVKPCFGASKKPRVTFKLDNEKKVKNDRPTRVKTKAELKYMEDGSAVLQNFIPPVLRPPMYPTHTVTVKNSSSGYFGQKRHKKMSIAAQVKRSKEGEVDLVSPDSILSKINVRTLINFETFNLLPKHYQYQLVKLLPDVDQDVSSKGEIRPTRTAFSNEFFTSAFESWKERLSEGEFTPEMSQKIQQEQEKIFNQDPWKTKHFESVWGEKLLESERYISPVERSHLIMEQVHIEWEKEQERLAKEKAEKEKLKKEQEKLKETENTDLSAPNKVTSNEQEPVKNLTSKQKAALVRQQKLAKAKSVSNKAHKKTSKSGKNSSKNTKDSGAVKVTEKNKTKQVTKSGAKQAKVKSPTNVPGSDVQTLGSDVVVDVVGSPGQGNADSGMTLAETGSEEVKPTSSEGPTSLPREPTSVLPGIFVSAEQPATKEKPNKKSTKKKKEPKGNAVNNTLGFPCMCVLKPMVMCRRCGAFCHSDCISPMSICAACVA